LIVKKLFLKILIYLYDKKGITISKYRQETILEKNYYVLKGSIRKNPDYDDAWLFALAQDAEIIFDIGANIGQAALIMMHSNSIQKIFLVDPNPLALGQAANNLIFNHLSHNAHFICSFASDKIDQLVPLYTVLNGASGSTYPDNAKTAAKMNIVYNVPTTTIDALIDQFDVIPDLVKIDTEGAELLVLKGAEKLTLNGKTRFFVEMHSNPKMPMIENAEKVINWCKDHQYQAWYLKEKQPLTKPEQIAHHGRCHLLLLPQNMGFPEYLLPLKQGARFEEVETQ